MKKTLSQFTVLFFCLVAFSLNATDILQPVDGLTPPSIIVKTGDKIYDSGGPGGGPDGSPGNYLNCSDRTDNDCISTLKLCAASGIVCVNFSSIVLANGGLDLLTISIGGSYFAPSAGTTYTSNAVDGCISIKFQGTSILNAAGWAGDIIVKGVPQDLPPNENCNLVCNDHVNASMPSDPGCMRTFVAADFLQNPTGDCQYQVRLSYPFGTVSYNPAIKVDRSHLGYTFVYSVYTLDGSNSCWGYVTIEDKAAPQPACKSRKLSCFQVGELNSQLGVVIDNCAQDGYSKIESLRVESHDCSDPRGIATVYRTIRSWDTWGNTSSCTDSLTITRDSLKNVKCDSMLVELPCTLVCAKNTDAFPKRTFNFSKDKTNADYPTPELLKLLKKYCPSGWLVGGAMVTSKSRVVPQLRDSVARITGTYPNTVCVLVDSCVDMWPAIGGICKTTVGYTDEILEICPGGAGFKIRRQWRIYDWCANRDTVCIQYIKVEDKVGPYVNEDDYISNINADASPHDCYARVNLPAFKYTDCSPVDQTYIIEYSDNSHPGKTVVLAGTLPATGISLPASPYGDCFQVAVTLTDKCYNRSNYYYYVCVYDVTPPTPVCDEFTRTTVDPQTCWARIYAHDLDNGSRDNCCNVLHFAVATMPAIDAARKSWVDYLTANCKADYWKYKNTGITNGYYLGYDAFIEEWINCYVFKDYIDLTECGTNQVVLRVYEACGVPRYDPHVFPCSEHDWFTYNTYAICRAAHNYSFFGKNGKKDCAAKFPILCREDIYKYANKQSSELPFIGDLTGAYPGSIGSSIFEPFQSCIPYVYLFEYFPNPIPLNTTAGNTSYSGAPGNRCSARLYNDCMVNVTVDDKTPPVCEAPPVIYWYCDNVGGKGNADNYYEYAYSACRDDDYTDDFVHNTSSKIEDNAHDYTCRDGKGNPYGLIECIKENDGDLTDTLDGTKAKYYGYYGCGASAGHEDEHGAPTNACDQNDYRGIGKSMSNEEIADRFRGFSVWTPVYCHTWLTLDTYDQAGQVNAKSAFWTPVLRSGGRGADVADGKFLVWDNCWIGTIDSVDTKYVDQCGNGWYQRTWTAKDKCGASVTCSQKIYTYHRSDFEVMFPADVLTNCDADGGASPDVTGRPMIMDDECELVGVNYEDVRYDVVPDACYKIIRTWKLIDWCKYDPNAHHRFPDVILDDRFSASDSRSCVYRKLKDDGDGYMEYTQIIKVIDTEAPVVAACKSDTLCITTGYGGFGAETDPMCTPGTYTTALFTATDNCTPSNLIEFRWELKNGAGVITKGAPKATRFSSSTLTVGVYTLYVIGTDKCGNEDTSQCTITVRDCKKPTPYCYNGIATVIMPSTGSVVVWASDLNAGSYDNCTKKVDLTYKFGRNGQASDTFSCANVPNGVSATVEVEVWVTDKSGNTDFCRTYLLIQDGNGNACPDQSGVAGSIAGKVATESTEPVENVVLEVKSSSNAIPAFKTASNGSYAFGGLPMKTDFSITPKRDDDPTNGVSTIDLVLIQKHILGVQPLNSAYKIIAADVDRSNDISAVDLVELRKLILTVYDKLPNNTSWRFVPKSYSFSNINSPWGFPEKLDIASLSKDELNRDFVGVKVGDVNGTVVPHSLLGAEARTGGNSLKFNTIDRSLRAGEEAVVEFTSANFNSIEGYQFSLAMKGLELKSVQSGVLKVSESNFGMTKLGEGYITTSWNESRGITAGSNDVLFSITVKATKTTTLSASLVINSKYTRAEAYGNNENLGVALEIGTRAGAGYVLNQNSPNPFKGTTVISYELAKTTDVTVKITDVTGRIVKSFTNAPGNKGYNQLKVNRSDISGAGVMYYTIETKDFTATKKMIIVE